MTPQMSPLEYLSTYPTELITQPASMEDTKGIGLKHSTHCIYWEIYQDEGRNCQHNLYDDDKNQETYKWELLVQYLSYMLDYIIQVMHM